MSVRKKVEKYDTAVTPPVKASDQLRMGLVSEATKKPRVMLNTTLPPPCFTACHDDDLSAMSDVGFFISLCAKAKKVFPAKLFPHVCL